MENKGWIKIHREVLDNPIARKPNYWSVWNYLLLKANHSDNAFISGNEKHLIKRGQLLTSKHSISEFLHLPIASVHNILSYLEREQMIEQKSTSKYTVISILNYESFQECEQSSERKSVFTRKQNETNNNVKNERNILLKSNIVNEKPRNIPNPEVDFIINTYKELIGHNPTDKKPRFVAQNLRKAITKMMKTLEGTAYKSDYKETVIKCFNWYVKKFEGYEGDKLDVVYRKVTNLLIPATLKKYDKQV